MKTIIIDDDRQAAEALETALKEYDEIEFLGHALNGMDGLKLLNDVQPDLLFLDVGLPDISGIDFLERLTLTGNTRCRVVMFTAYGRFMLPAFRNKAFDYLLKPIDRDELRKVMRRVCLEDAAAKAVQTDVKADKAPDIDGIKRGNDGKYLLYTNSVDFRLVDIRDIGVFSYNRDLRLWEVSVSGIREPVRLKRTVTSDALLGLDSNLVRVSQSHIINVTYLIEVTDNTCHFYPPFDKITDVHVGRFFRKKLIDRFCSL